MMYTDGPLYSRIFLIEINVSTIAKEPSAQHIPGLTAMVPAFVHARGKIVPPKAILKLLVPTFSSASRPAILFVVNLELVEPSVAISKPQHIGDSYTTFSKNVKMLGTPEEMNLIQSDSSNLQSEAIPLIDSLNSFQEFAKLKDQCVVLIRDLKLIGLGLENKGDMSGSCSEQHCEEPLKEPNPLCSTHRGSVHDYLQAYKRLIANMANLYSNIHYSASASQSFALFPYH